MKRNFIPVDEKDRDLILKIQKSVCNSDIMDKMRYNLIPETFDIYTVVIAFMDGVHRLLMNADVEVISIGELLVIEKTVRNNAKAEKSGNINCKMYLGDVGKALVEQGIDGFEDVLEEDTDLRKVMLAAAAFGIRYLADYAMSGLKAEDVYHIASIFFVYMILLIDECSKNENLGDELRLEIGSKNLSYFTIGYKRGSKGTVITLNVGPALKLTVKSDGLTE